MNTKDKTTRLSVRLTENQLQYLQGQADLLGITPSEYLRQVLNYAIGQMLLQEREAKNADKKAAVNNQL